MNRSSMVPPHQSAPSWHPSSRFPNPHRPAGLATLLILALGGLAMAAPIGESEKVGPVAAQAFADHEAIAPGDAFKLAVVLKLDPGYHIYWQNPNGTGQPTEIEWKAPDGYQFGRLRYPVPQVKDDKVLNETSYVYEGAATLLTPVRVPDSAKPGEQITFTANGRWLVCRESCIQGTVKLSLTLPVVAKGTPPKPANEKLFKEAAAAIPEPTEKAEHVKLTGSIDKETVKPGDKFTATLTAEIQAAHHMQSNKPLDKTLIPAVLFVERTPDFEAGEVTYPKAVEHQDKLLGKLSEYSGKVEFKIPMEVLAEADKKPRWIRGVLQYQICSDAGTCFPPQRVEFSIPVQMAGGPKPPAAEDEIAASSTQGATSGGAQIPPPIASEEGWFSRFQGWLIGLGFFGVILCGLLGGFLLNLMPCVLPVISLKVLSFVKQAHDDRWRIFRMGLTYSAGIMVFYVVLAVLFFVWHKGWGELFQSPTFVIIMAAVIMAFAMSLFGVFALFTPKVVNELGAKAEAQEGYLSAFATGILATLLGTACTAPFLSAAIGYAAQLPPAQGTSIFLATGFGMAFPFILLTYNPSWLRFLPKPGPWMGMFEKIMGFLLLGTVIWLLNPLRGQLGAYGMLLTMIFLLAVAIAVWLKGLIQFGDPVERKIKLYGTAVLILLVGWMLPFRWMATIPSLTAEHIEKEDLAADGQLLRELLKEHPDVAEKLVPRPDWSADKIQWRQYRRLLAMLAVEYGYTVFVDYTADWCASCKTNLKTSIDRGETIKVMRELNVVCFEADYTVTRPEITEDLQRFKRAGVPMYLVYSPGNAPNPQVLPELLTPQIVTDALRKAGPSKPINKNQAASQPAAPSAPAPEKPAAKEPAKPDKDAEDEEKDADEETKDESSEDE